MHSKTLALTTAVAVSLFMISACNKTPAAAPAAAPVAPAAETTPAPATTVAPPVAAPAPAVAAPAPAPAPMAEGRGGKRGGKGGGKAGKAALREACAADIAKFCTAGEKPGKCLRPHKDELSQACQTARAERKAERQGQKGAE